MSLLTVPLKAVGRYRENLSGVKVDADASIKRISTNGVTDYEVSVGGKPIGLLSRRELLDALDRGWQAFGGRIVKYSGDEGGRSAPSISVCVFYSLGPPTKDDLQQLREFQANPPPAPPRPYSVGIVGESHRQPAIARTRVGERVTIVHDSRNVHDRRAMAVMNARGEQIGFLPRDGWLTRALLDEQKTCQSRVSEVHRAAPGRPYAAVVLEVLLQ